jgi:hypothetical protein
MSINLIPISIIILKLNIPHSTYSGASEEYLFGDSGRWLSMWCTCWRSIRSTSSCDEVSGICPVVKLAKLLENYSGKVVRLHHLFFAVNAILYHQSFSNAVGKDIRSHHWRLLFCHHLRLSPPPPLSSRYLLACSYGTETEESEEDRRVQVELLATLPSVFPFWQR